ncbi:MAG: hypothetical protein GY774_16280, partial [Planctomycetes bacterium]|nr:hypothetical protein [Planctomycetota bacterium]
MTTITLTISMRTTIKTSKLFIFAFSIVLLMASITFAGIDDLDLPSEIVQNGEIKSYAAHNSISVGPSFTVESGGDATLRAGTGGIALKPIFHAKKGSKVAFKICFNPDGDCDSDGFSENEGDCDDTDPAMNPGAQEACDGVDNNCNGQIDEGVKPTFYHDVDGDGYGNPGDITEACQLPSGYVTDNTDCDDNDAAVNPGAAEEPYNGKDDDCNPATPDDDLDSDGYGIATDCNDTSAAINPNAAEVCDGVDNNCDGQIDEGLKTTFYEDSDNDGYGNPNSSLDACTQPSG